MHALNCLKLSYKPKTNEFRFKGLVIYADHGEAKIGNTVILKKAKGKIIMTSWLVGNPEEFQVLQDSMSFPMSQFKPLKGYRLRVLP